MGRSDDPGQRYATELARLAQAAESGEMSTATHEAICELLDALDGEQRRPVFRHGGKKVELAANSLAAYGLRLRLLAGEIDGELLELTNDDVTALVEALQDGRAGIGPEAGYANGTLGQFESALIAFYRYHDGEHAVDPDAIDVDANGPGRTDPREMWTVEEVEALRSHINSKRDEALFELLAYTGQRIRVIQTLRVKDVDPDYGDSGRYYVNDSVQGLKNRDGHGPLLGARGAVKRWLRVHPTGEPDDALITCTDAVRYGPGDDEVTVPGEPLTQRTMARTLERIKERAGVDKRVHPHMFRHYFSTIALTPKSRGGFGMDPTYVKRLRGDVPGSTVLETTYAHLIDEDASAHAEEQFSGERPANALTPAAPCGVCGEMLNAGDKACAHCGAKRDPTAEKSEMERLQERVEQLEAGREVQQEIGVVKALKNGEISDAELEAIAQSDALLSKLIEIRTGTQAEAAE